MLTCASCSLDIALPHPCQLQLTPQTTVASLRSPQTRDIAAKRYSQSYTRSNYITQ